MAPLSDRNILLLGPSGDRTLAHFHGFLEGQDVDFQLIPLERVFENGSVGLGPDGAVIRWDDLHLNLAYSGQRMFNRLILPPDASLKTQAQKRILTAFLQRAEGRIVNEPFAGLSNYSKAAQAVQFSRSKAAFPASLLTNSVDKFNKFRDAQGAIIYKSPSSVRTIVALYDEDSERRLAYLRASPVLFQEYIPGKDVRVHVIGQRCIAEEISGGGVDYRYDAPGMHVYNPIELPPEIEKLCVNLSRQMDLAFAGIDFKVDRDGKYWILEVNPMPGYEDYDRRAGYAISQALLDYFMGE